MMEECHLYFVSAVGRNITKIGISADPRKRLAGLKTASPYPLALFASVCFEGRAQAERAERIIHAALADHRMSGEWFAISAASALEVNDAVSDMIRIGDFHPDDFVGLCQMLAFQCLGDAA
jgi:hypothetical protein